MHGEEAQEPPGVPIGIVEPKQAQLLVLVVLILRSFLGGVSKVCARTSIPVPIDNCRISNGELARLQRRVGTLDREDCTLYDGVCSFFDVPECCDFGEDVLQVATDTTVLMRGRERDVGVVVQVGVERGQLRDDRATDTCITHGNVCSSVSIQLHGMYKIWSSVPALMNTNRCVGSEASATIHARLRCRRCSPVSVWARLA